MATLKSNLSSYLNAVKKGKEIVVTSHRHPIARLSPIDGQRMAPEIVPASKPVSSLKKIRAIKLKVDPVAVLLADRRRR